MKILAEHQAVERVLLMTMLNLILFIAIAFGCTTRLAVNADIIRQMKMMTNKWKS